MTKEELEKEADDYVHNHWTEDEEHDVLIKQAYLASAESREKRIAELEATNKKISDECHKLVDTLEKEQNENADLIGKVAFLENDLNNAKAQIEKMKCCPTCDNNKEEHTPEEHYRCKTCKKFCNWELAD